MLRLPQIVYIRDGKVGENENCGWGGRRITRGDPVLGGAGLDSSPFPLPCLSPCKRDLNRRCQEEREEPCPLYRGVSPLTLVYYM